ncbi:Werner helicase interacting protein 1 [Linnemannia hyalina]|uniref:Werner helicase interacting protein 1 n=1 Tax=Linnemannia hyalina TaxID=64524 RepID=A0A9P7XMV9_9FUNG|nr:Werner helicase interacting protein 1 [Linnemannia hyalina]
MESVAESLTSGKRKHGDTVDDFDDIDGAALFQDNGDNYTADINRRDSYPASSATSSSQQQQQQQQHQQISFQSRKDKANAAVQRSMPLAERGKSRPASLDDFIGQKELVGPGGILRALVLQDTVPSIILWGPCGVGKTTLARIIAHTTKAQFKEMGATTHGVADVSHRFTKSQQDIFLPFVERGTITLIGATTENPSFRVNSALLSRCRVLTLEKLSLEDGMDKMIQRAARIKWRDILDMACAEMTETELATLNSTFGQNDRTFDEWVDAKTEPGAIKWLIDLSDGDGRSAINTLEIGIQGLSTIILSDDSMYGNSQKEQEDQAEDRQPSGVLERLNAAKLTGEVVKMAFQKTHLQYDRQGDEHYNLISALHKSVRGGDADAALYWLGRMLVSGEEPLYIARRLIRMASEDIGMADSAALPLAVSTYQACQMIGMPECDVNLAHCVAYMAKAKKSVDVYYAYGQVKQTVSEEFAYPIPIHLRNAPTTLMKDLGYGDEYKYNPLYPEGTKVDQEYLPKGLKKRKFMGEAPVMTLGEDGEWRL